MVELLLKLVLEGPVFFCWSCLYLMFLEVEDNPLPLRGVEEEHGEHEEGTLMLR